MGLIITGNSLLPAELKLNGPVNLGAILPSTREPLLPHLIDKPQHQARMRRR